MKLVLCAGEMDNNKLDIQVNRMEEYMRSNKAVDFLVFGESYLNGFDGLTWDYEIDIDRGISLEDDLIGKIQEMCLFYSSGLSFSFIERLENNLYCSNLVIDRNGNIIDLFRRKSPGWKDESAGPNYCEGKDFQTFDYKDKRILVAICGDLWFDENIARINELEADLIFWPLYIDYLKDQWHKEAKFDYREQTSKLKAPVLMVNSYMEGLDTAKGGAYFFDRGLIIQELALGKAGSLEIEI